MVVVVVIVVAGGDGFRLWALGIGLCAWWLRVAGVRNSVGWMCSVDEGRGSMKGPRPVRYIASLGRPACATQGLC